MRVGPSVPRHFTLFISSVISILPRQISTNGPVFSTSVGGCRRQQVSVFCCANAAPFLRPSIDGDGGGGATSQGKSKRDGLRRNKRRVSPRFDVRKQNFDAAHCYQTRTSAFAVDTGSSCSSRDCCASGWLTTWRSGTNAASTMMGSFFNWRISAGGSS